MDKMPEFKIEDYLKNDLDMQKEYLNQLLNLYIEDGNIEAFLSALKPLIQMHGSLTEFAKKQELTEHIFINFLNIKLNLNFRLLY